jgi:general stress protein 26
MGEVKKDRKVGGSIAELREMLKEFDTTMLVTQTSEGLLRGRPMAMQKLEDLGDCDLWLVTSDDSPKVAEIAREHDVCVVCYRPGDRAYVSISARARAERDPLEIRRLWQPDWKAWWDGPDDPTITILKLDVQRAEYWEPEGGRLRVLYEMAKGALAGKRPDESLNPPKTV